MSEVDILITYYASNLIFAGNVYRDDIYTLNKVFFYFEKYFWIYGQDLVDNFGQIWVISVKCQKNHSVYC